MTDDQINEAIADAISHRLVLGNSQFYKSGDGWVVDCPNYCNDLNAMHEAEAVLNEDQLWRMAREIERNDDQWYFRATARQRAEAFLRTLGKWEDAK